MGFGSSRRSHPKLGCPTVGRSFRTIKKNPADFCSNLNEYLLSHLATFYIWETFENFVPSPAPPLFLPCYSWNDRIRKRSMDEKWEWFSRYLKICRDFGRPKKGQEIFSRRTEPSQDRGSIITAKTLRALENNKLGNGQVEAMIARKKPEQIPKYWNGNRTFHTNDQKIQQNIQQKI